MSDIQSTGRPIFDSTVNIVMAAYAGGIEIDLDEVHSKLIELAEKEPAQPQKKSQRKVQISR